MDFKIIPGILRTTEAEYKKDLEAANEFTSYIQIDVIDGVYAPQKTVQADVIAKHPATGKAEVDLMVVDPVTAMRPFLLMPFVDQVIVHVETVERLQPIIDIVHSYNKKCALAMNPDTPMQFLNDAHKYDQVVFMGVTPGKQGQPFQNEVLQKITEARFRHHELPIEVDGGMKPETIVEAKRAGANYFISGSFIFWSDNPKQKYEELGMLVA